MEGDRLNHVSKASLQKLRVLSASLRHDGGHGSVSGRYRPPGLRPEGGSQTRCPAEAVSAGRDARHRQTRQLGGQVQDTRQERHAAARSGEQQLHHSKGETAADISPASKTS